MLSKERFINACRFEPVDRPPVWMMRQAGRTLPEYLSIREKYSFTQIMKSPELAAQVTLQPLRRFNAIDAAVIFCDILVIPEALGMEVQYSPKLSISPHLHSLSDISYLKVLDIERKLDYVTNTIRIVQKEAGHEKAILGFSGAPFTLACYMIEGGSSKHFEKVRELMYLHPAHFKNLMELLSEAVTQYLTIQMDSNVTAVQLFDTWAGELSPQNFNRFVLPYVSQIVSKLKHKDVPIIYYINGIGNLLHEAKSTEADIIGVDWRFPITEVREKLGPDTVIQGNLDPALLFASETEIREQVFQMLNATSGRGHIANLGHGLIPNTPLSGIQAFIDAVTQWSPTQE